MRIHPALLLFAAGAAFGQSAAPTVAFEVASIKPSPPPNGRGIRVGCQGGPAGGDPGRITCTNINLANLVQMAYGISHYQLAGISPTDQDRYEIAVKLPEGTTKDQVGIMWQNLLAERFKLVTHREQRDVQRYELVIAKGGPKMQVAAEEPAPNPDKPAAPPPPDTAPRTRMQLGKDGYPDLTPGMSMAMMGNKARWHGIRQSAPQIAGMLSSQLGQPVSDATGLTQKYDFVLSWVTGPGGRGAAAASQSDGNSPIAALGEADEGPNLVTAVQSQLGLKLEQKKGTMEVLVVDHAEKAPIEN